MLALVKFYQSFAVRQTLPPGKKLWLPPLEQTLYDGDKEFNNQKIENPR